MWAQWLAKLDGQCGLNLGASVTPPVCTSGSVSGGLGHWCTLSVASYVAPSGLSQLWEQWTGLALHLGNCGALTYTAGAPGGARPSPRTKSVFPTN